MPRSPKFRSLGPRHPSPLSTQQRNIHHSGQPSEACWLRVPPWGLFWLLAGGIAYTGGVAFYAAKRVRYSHFVWHLFVITGTACHFIAVLRYAV